MNPLELYDDGVRSIMDLQLFLSLNLFLMRAMDHIDTKRW